MSVHELQAALAAVKEKREALRAAADAGEGIGPAMTLLHDAKHALEAAARRVTEGAGEPVAWQWFSKFDDEWQPVLNGERAARLRIKGQRVRPLYTTPPSADELVEALRMIVEADDNHNLKGKDIDRARAALAKHKENTDGR